MIGGRGGGGSSVPVPPPGIDPARMQAFAGVSQQPPNDVATRGPPGVIGTRRQGLRAHGIIPAARRSDLRPALQAERASGRRRRGLPSRLPCNVDGVPGCGEPSQAPALAGEVRQHFVRPVSVAHRSARSAANETNEGPGDPVPWRRVQGGSASLPKREAAPRIPHPVSVERASACQSFASASLAVSAWSVVTSPSSAICAASVAQGDCERMPVRPRCRRIVFNHSKGRSFTHAQSNRPSKGGFRSGASNSTTQRSGSRRTCRAT